MNERRVRAAHVGIRAALIALRLGFFAGALAGPFVAGAALAAQRPYVTVYGIPSDPIVLRLVPELKALGCVVRVDASPTTDPQTFMEGDAVVRVTATNVTFWLLDPGSGHAPEKGTVEIDDRGPEGIELTSVRVSEIVRAQLLRVVPRAASSQTVVDTVLPAANVGAPTATRDAATDAPTPETSGPDAAPAARSRADAAVRPSPSAAIDTGARRDDAPSHVALPVPVPTPPHLSAGIGPVLLLGPGGTKPALDLALSSGWHPSRSLQLRALLAAPLTAPSIVATGGEAAIATWLGGAAIDWQLNSNDDHWRGTLGGGAAAVLSHAHGTAIAPYVASTTNAVSALPFVEMGGSRGLGTPSVRLGVSGMLGVALPEMVVQFAALKVATWGLPVVGAVSGTLDVDVW